MSQLALWVLSGLTIVFALIVLVATVISATRVRVLCSLASIWVVVLCCLNVLWAPYPEIYNLRYPFSFAIFSPLYLDLVIILFLDVGLRFHEALGINGLGGYFYAIVSVAVLNTLFDYAGLTIEHLQFVTDPETKWIIFCTQMTTAIALALAAALYALVPLMLTVRRKKSTNSYAFAVGVWYFGIVFILYTTYSVLYAFIMTSHTDFNPNDQAIDLFMRLLALVAQSLPAPRSVIVKIRNLLFDSQMKQRVGSNGGIGVHVSVEKRSNATDFDIVTTDTYFPFSIVSEDSSPRRAMFDYTSKNSYDSGSDFSNSAPSSPRRPYAYGGPRLSPVMEGGSEESYQPSEKAMSQISRNGYGPSNTLSSGASTVSISEDTVYSSESAVSQISRGSRRPGNALPSRTSTASISDDTVYSYQPSQNGRGPSNIPPSTASISDDEVYINPQHYRSTPSRGAPKPSSRDSTYSLSTDDSAAYIIPQRDFRRGSSRTASTVSIQTDDDSNIVPQRDFRIQMSRAGSNKVSPYPSTLSMSTDDEVYINPQNYGLLSPNYGKPSPNYGKSSSNYEMPSPVRSGFTLSPHTSTISITTDDDEVYINPKNYHRITMASAEKKTIQSVKSIARPPAAKTKTPGKNNHRMVAI
ncbi:hypothetical protein BC937DRAFT_89110 [Endogone sp. FLAS-F59071]|nr:hypothetical protein BC937DRAFT_89110 [Endogone sp. FLAS-F59071]|eukprot:RUS18143.1 hypothetical protein BC937DRAFT_89110 [Endogone sp. FLAS-F59071]